METITVQLTHKKAIKLLEELEELHIIKLLKNNVPSNQNKKNIAYKFAGKLSMQVAEDMQQYITKSRKEWSKNS